MFRSIRRMIVCAILMSGLALVTPAGIRAHDKDYNAYWQDRAETQQQEQIEAQQLQQNYTAYWNEQAELQQQQQQ
jgi:hypothetical protein